MIFINIDRQIAMEQYYIPLTIYGTVVYKHIPFISPLQTMAYTSISKLPVVTTNFLVLLPRQNLIFPKWTESHVTSHGDCHTVVNFILPSIYF